MYEIEKYHKAVQSHLRVISEIRTKLTGIIRDAVERHSYIGTFYKNLGEHHTKDQTEKEYDDSPIVAIQNGTYKCYGGFEGNTVYDIFIDPEDGRLLVTLNGEAGEDFDEPIEHVQVEGLLYIVSWLAENGFVEAAEENPLRCVECGSLNIERQGWLNPNSEKFIGFTEQDDKGDNWCNDCEEHTHQVLENELINTIDYWFENDLKPGDPEVISGLDPNDYTTEEEYDTACMELWRARCNEGKIFIWKTLTYDKRCDETF